MAGLYLYSYFRYIGEDASSVPDHSSKRTGSETVPAVQAVFLLNKKRFCGHIDALLRTFTVTDAAATAIFSAKSLIFPA